MSAHYSCLELHGINPELIINEELGTYLPVFFVSSRLVFEVQISIIRLISPSNLEPFNKCVIQSSKQMHLPCSN